MVVSSPGWQSPDRAQTVTAGRLGPPAALRPGRWHLVQAFPDPNRRRGHVDVVDASRVERVQDRVDHRGWCADRPGFAHALDAERVRLARHLVEVEEERREMVRTWHAVFREGGRQELSR